MGREVTHTRGLPTSSKPSSRAGTPAAAVKGKAPLSGGSGRILKGRGGGSQVSGPRPLPPKGTQVSGPPPHPRPLFQPPPPPQGTRVLTRRSPSSVPALSPAPRGFSRLRWGSPPWGGGRWGMGGRAGGGDTPRCAGPTPHPSSTWLRALSMRLTRVGLVLATKRSSPGGGGGGLSGGSRGPGGGGGWRHPPLPPPWASGGGGGSPSTA